MLQPVKVFKFGGASVKDADAVRNLVSIVQHFKGQPLVVVVSAMGKMTNALEQVVEAAVSGHMSLPDLLKGVTGYHRQVMESLFGDPLHPVFREVEALLDELSQLATQPSVQPYDLLYDQIVPYGELVSTTIISHYLNYCGVANHWADARRMLLTDDTWRDARIMWDETRQAVADTWKQTLTAGDSSPLMLTQGFIGMAPTRQSTTLGREGSDFTAAVLAWSLDAESVTIWKDVPGMLNADPKYFPDTVKLEQISYEEAIELAYYGATVIHPKTIKPLQNKQIPLYVKSFVYPAEEGSVIGPFAECRPDVPSYIFKTNQVLISIAPRDFSFIAEKNLQIIFGVFGAAGIRINLMQNSAISFSVCVDQDVRRIPAVIGQLKNSFRVRYNEGLQLITIRRYTPGVIEKIVAGRKILVEQRSRLTAQLVVE